MKTTQHLDDAEAVGTPARPTEAEEYDLLILGSGAAGKLLSWTLAKTGMKTATRDNVIDKTVNPISSEPFIADSKAGLPCSRCLTMFSSTTIASSTTKPTERVNAIKVKLFRLNLKKNMAANVPMMEIGKAKLGINVADAFPRKR